jgi:inward rectifier potassium channel
MASLFENFEIERSGISRNPFRDLYTKILLGSWPKFLFQMVVLYFVLNLTFALFYCLQLGSIQNSTGSIFDAFAFSVQTFATIGYGYFLPNSTYSHILVVVESIVGIVYTALFTGLTFAKFSRANINVVFSRNVILTHFNGVPTLMFRIGNGKDSNIIDANLKLVTLVREVTSEGHVMQRLTELDLVRDMNPFFILTWTAMHTIDSKSPLFSYIQNEKLSELELLVSLVGYDETYMQTVHTSYRYKKGTVVKAKKFVDVMSVFPDGRRKIDFTKFHEIEN